MGSAEGVITSAELLATLAPYFDPGNGGHMIDRAWQPRLAARPDYLSRVCTRDEMALVSPLAKGGKMIKVQFTPT